MFGLPLVKGGGLFLFINQRETTINSICFRKIRRVPTFAKTLFKHGTRV